VNRLVLRYCIRLGILLLLAMSAIVDGQYLLSAAVLLFVCAQAGDL